MPELAMFPLGTVLFPHMVLPLHVFEPRYRLLLADVLSADRRFGVVLIERGHEVGGGEVRTDVGTVASIVRAEELDDGRFLVIAVGTERVRVRSWLDDDPYPRAEVEVLTEGPSQPRAAIGREAVAQRLRRVVALQAELDEPAPPLEAVDLAPDPVIASYQAAVLAPLSPLDAQRLLTTDSADARLDLLDRNLVELESLLRFRLHGADPHEEDRGRPPGQ